MKKFSATILASLVFSLLLSCGKDHTPASSMSVTTLDKLGAASGNFRLIATDAPFNYDNVASAKINVNRVEVKSKTDVSTSLVGQPFSLDLIKLKNGLVTVLVDLNLPPGEYKEIMLVIETGSLDLVSGEHYNLKIPSGTTSGLKVSFNPAINITTQASSDILVDFDLSGSFVPQGDMKDASSINGFTFKPVVRAANLTTAGTIKGKVISDMGTPSTADDSALAGAMVTVKQGNAAISSTVTDASGNYQMIGLPQGDYSLEVSSVDYTTSQPLSYTIVAGNVTTAQDTLLAKLPPATP